MLGRKFFGAIGSLGLVGLLAVALGSSLAEAQPFAYVTDSDRCFKGPTNRCVSVIDTASNTYKAAVMVGFSNATNGVATTPDGTRAYVTSSSGVLVIDTSTNMLTATIPVSCGGRIAITPDGKRAYVVNGCLPTVHVIDTDPTPNNAATYNTKILQVGTPYQGDGIAITPGGTLAYLAPLSSPDPVQVINIAPAVPVVLPSLFIFPGVPLPSGAGFLGGIAIAPDGNAAYVTLTGLSSTFPPRHSGFAMIDLSSSSIACFGYLTNLAGFGSPLPYSVAMTPDDTRAYALTAESLTMITNGTCSAMPVAGVAIPLGSQGGAGQIAVAPDGKHAYIAASQGHSVFVFDTGNNSFSAVIRVGETHGIAITPPCITVALQVANGAVPPNPDDNKHIKLGILSNLAFTAPTSVDTTKPLTFGHTGDEQSLVAGSCGPKNVNNDGLLDLVCSFDNGIASLQPGETAVLKATTLSGMCIKGTLTIPAIKGEAK